MNDRTENAFWAWRTIVTRRQSTDVVDPLVHEAWVAGANWGRKDGFSISAQWRGAIDVLEDLAALMRAWELEREAIDLVGQEVMP